LRHRQQRQEPDAYTCQQKHRSAHLHVDTFTVNPGLGTPDPAPGLTVQVVSGQGPWSHWHAISTSLDPASLQA
jgi:hypothetical protein